MTAALVRGDTASRGEHIHQYDTHPNYCIPMLDLVPGGYLFTHLIFWTVIAMVAVGTQAVAIILSVGLGLLVVEAFTQGR